MSGSLCRWEMGIGVVLAGLGGSGGPFWCILANFLPFLALYDDMGTKHLGLSP